MANRRKALMKSDMAFWDQMCYHAAVLEIPIDKSRKRQMPVQVTVAEDILVRDKPFHEIEKAVREGLVIRAYVTGEISIGEVRELLGFQYMDDVADWLHERGIATMRKFKDPDLVKAQQTGFENLRRAFSER